MLCHGFSETYYAMAKDGLFFPALPVYTPNIRLRQCQYRLGFNRNRFSLVPKSQSVNFLGCFLVGFILILNFYAVIVLRRKYPTLNVLTKSG